MRETETTVQTENTVLVTLAGKRKILGIPNFEKQVAFGPINSTQFWEGIEEEAVEKVVEKSAFTASELIDAMRAYEDDARTSYAADLLNNLSGPEFCKMMTFHGCFFLLLAYSILGATAGELKFVRDHAVYGCVEENMTLWIKSMFSVGNQIPFVVLEKLMELSFFQEIKSTKIWKQPQKLVEKVLHKFLITRQEGDPLDLIHCLQSIVLGVRDAISASARVMDCDMNQKGEICARHLPVDKNSELIYDCLKQYENLHYEAGGILPEATSFLVHLDELHTPSKFEYQYMTSSVGDPHRK